MWIAGTRRPATMVRRHPTITGSRIMNSRQRVEAALNHEQPDYVPLDLGASPVTGMQVSSVYKLRQALGLDPPGTPVKVVEPYQMLGEIAPDLQEALGVDVVPLGGRRNMFGFENAGWKPWTTFDGTPVLVPERFNTVPDANGDILLYPEGDTSVPPSGRMPKGGFYFDSITRQEPIDDDNLRVEDNLEEFGPVSDADLQYFAREAQRLRSESDRAILANFGGTAFGDIALVPAPWLKHPKGIRDVAEWYMSTAARVDFVYQHLRAAVRDRPGEPGQDPRGGGRSGLGGLRHRHRFRHAGRTVHQPQELSQPLPAVPSAASTTGSTSTPTGRRSSTPAARSWPWSTTSSTPASTSSIRCSVRRWAWIRRRSRTSSARGSRSGAAASIRRRRCPSARRTTCAARSGSGSRSSTAAAVSSSTRCITCRPPRPLENLRALYETVKEMRR